MMLRRAINKLGVLVSEAIFALVWLAAWALAPLRSGRLLRAVCMPRMREHRLRTTLTVLGVALGVAVLVAVVTANHSIVAGTKATLDDLSGKADLQISAGASGFDESLLDVVKQVDGVYRLTPVTQQIVNLRTSAGQRERLLLLGVDLLGQEDAHFRSYASRELTEIQRDPLHFLNSANNVIVSRQFAERVGAKLHDKLRLGTASGVQEFEVWGFIDDVGVGRAFGGAVAVMYYPAMQVSFGFGRNINRIDVAVSADRNPEQVQALLKKRLGAGFSVDRPALRGEPLAKMLSAMRAGLSMASVIALIAGMFLVFNTCAIGVVQRKRELGIMRALGITRGQLVRLLTLEGALLGAAGSVLGVVFGVFLSSAMLRVTGKAVNELFVQQAVNQVQLDPGLVAGAFALGIFCSALAARFATQRASGVRPVEALSQAVVPSLLAPANGLSRADLVCISLSLLATGLFFAPPVGALPIGPAAAGIVLVFATQALLPRLIQLSYTWLSWISQKRCGAAVSLAIHNIPRDLGRTASMASGLMLGVALTISVAIFVSSFASSLNSWSGQILPGDLFVTSGNAISGLSARNIPMQDSVGAQLAAIAGVEQVRRIRIIDGSYRGAPIKISSSEFQLVRRKTEFTMLEGDQQDAYDEVEHGAVLVSENFARHHGVHRNEAIELATARGTQSFRVAGIVVDYTTPTGSVLLDRSTFVKFWGDDRVDTYELMLARNATADAVRAQINDQLGEQYDLFVLTNGEFRGIALKATSRIHALLWALEAITLLVAALGLTTTVFANVMDRVHEIGMLRALGMLRSQVGTMIVVETVIVGTIGTLAGAVLGSSVGYLVVKHVTSGLFGWHLPYYFPFISIMQLTVITLMISAMAGLFPARRAAGLVVRDALDYE
jgi:putative ABC transport system permease protein